MITLQSTVNNSQGIGERRKFLKSLMETHGVKEKQRWQNNNDTVSQRAYVIDVKKLSEIQKIISAIWNFNINHPEQRPLVAVPVAGWEATDYGILSSVFEKESLTYEYAQSFSLSHFTTGKNADVIIRISKEAQNMDVFKNTQGECFIKITPGCRITDIEQELATRKLALKPHMTTLHVASFVGAASNGCYGPGKNYTSMTTDIVEMKVITPKGEKLTLSEKENQKWFYLFRDCHMGAAFIVKELTIKNIEPDFLIKRTDLILKDFEHFNDVMNFKNLLNKEHFIMHFIPVGMNKECKDHFPQFRISTFERTIESPTETTKTLDQEQQDETDWENLSLTSLGEPLIDGIVGSKRLQKYFDVILDLAARKTFGTKPERVEIGPSAQTIHLLKTYTQSKITDINWLIEVPDVRTADELLKKLMLMITQKLTFYAKTEKYPILTVYARFLKGIYYPEAEGGVAPTAVDNEGDLILSFELLSYPELQKTEAFKDIEREVIKMLKNQYKFKYHPGKTWPDNLTSLTEIFTDKIDVQRLENFQNGVMELVGGKENLCYSTLLTPQKKHFIGLSDEFNLKTSVKKEEKISTSQRDATLTKIVEVAKEFDHHCYKSAKKMSKKNNTVKLEQKKV